MKLLLTIAIAVLQAFVVIIPLSGKLSDNRRNFPKNFTKRGWLLIVCCIVTIGFTMWIFNITQNEETTARNNLSSQLANRDSVNSRKLDSNNTHTVTLLAKYGYKVDSVNQVIIKAIKDSNKRVVIENIAPILRICDISVTSTVGYSSHFAVKYCSDDASSTNFRIKTFVVGTDSVTNLTLLSSNSDLDGITAISANNYHGRSFDLYNDINLSVIYFYVVGSYSNSDNSKQYNINDVYYYDINRKKNGTVTGNTRKKIVDFVTNR